MSKSRRISAQISHRVIARRIGFGLAVIGIASFAQGCSSTSESGDGGSWKLWGNDKPSAPKSQQASTTFDADGPSPNNSYRGGRDPVSGQAQQQWPPAAAPAERASMAPLPQQPAAAPAPAPYRAAPAQHRTAAAPAYAQAPAAAAASSVEVKTGDTLYRIAKAHNITVPALMQANSLSNESIKVGQRLDIPAR